MSIFDGLIHAVETASEVWAKDAVLDSVFDMGDIIHPEVMKLKMNDIELPWGRYLLHKDPEGRFNIQLDVFSSDYTGSCHAHESWGALWLLRGKLRVWDYDLKDGVPRVARYSLFGHGGFQCFAPPVSDWHKVGTPTEGPQTVSIHIYGPDFNMDTGLTCGEDGIIKSYTRGPIKDIKKALPAFIP